MYYVYVLYSPTIKKRYIGITNDLRRRFAEHNRGSSNFTNRGKPWNLLYYEAFVDKNDAEREEIFLKMGKGRERLDKLLFTTMKLY
jgi:putative endonuclease